jgi:hypothetical protein
MPRLNKYRRLNRDAALVAEVLRRRSSSDNGKTTILGWLSDFLKTGSGTALITVVIGGLLGAWISGRIQTGQKDREFQQSWLKGRGDQALIAYKDYLDKQQDTVRRVYERIGTSISASDDLIELTRPEFAVTNYQSEQKEIMKKYRAEVRDKYNTSEREWRNERETLGLLMNYYNSKQNTVLAAWKDVSGRVTAYGFCATQWVQKHPISNESDNPCKREKDAFSKSLEGLTKALEANRTYAWEGWESPDTLRSELEKKN